MNMTLRELAERVGGEIVGDDSVELTGVAGIREAKAGDLTFLANPKYERFLSTTAASAVVVSQEYRAAAAKDGRSLLVSADPYGVFAGAMELLAQGVGAAESGVHESAIVAESATLGEQVAIGPNAVVMDRASVGDRSRVLAGAYVGPDVSIGRDCVIHPNVTLEARCAVGDRVIIHAGSAVGGDGFGFAMSAEGAGHRKVPQIGVVVIEDDVEIGANVCIDRATVGSTRIGRGSKIDNLVQIGHNVVVGQDSIIVAQVGISGSTVVGSRVILAGQAGIVGHIEIGDGAVVGAQSGVTKSVPAGETVSGYPARRHGLSKVLAACLQELPALFRRVRTLEKKMSRFEEES